MKYNCIIVDDEPLAQNILEKYIGQVEKLTLLGKFSNAVTAFNFIQTQTPDIIFLDIKMPQMTGLEFLKNAEVKSYVIFTTAYREFAVESYELSAEDYLVKPISYPRFFKAINQFFKRKSATPTVEKNTSEQIIPSSEPPFLFLKSGKNLVKILLDDILYIESLKDYAFVHTIKKRLVISKNLTYFEHILPKDQFLRIHKSYIASLKKVDEYSSSEIKINSINLPVGRTFKKRFLNGMKLLSDSKL